MKRREWSGVLSAWLYGTVLTAAALSCPITAYDLPVSLSQLWWVSAVAAGLLALLWQLPGRVILLPCAAALYGAALCYWWDAVVAGMSCALELITEGYAAAYAGIPVLQLLPDASGASATPFFAAMVIPIAALIVCAVLHQWSAWVPLTAAFPWLAMCLVVVHDIPDLLMLWILLSAGLLLVLTQRARVDQQRAGLRLTLLLALPVAGVLFLLLLLQPPDTYERAAWPDTLQQYLSEETAQRLGMEYDEESGRLEWSEQLFTTTSAAWSAGQGETVDLTELGSRESGNRLAMRVRAGVDGVQYLRGGSLSGYVDNSWVATPVTPPADYDPLRAVAGELQATDTIEIRTNGIYPQLFTPYFLISIPEGTLTDDAFYRNENRLGTYVLSYISAPTRTAPSTTEAQLTYDQIAWETALTVPEPTRQGLWQLAEEAGLTELPLESLPNAVAEYVRSAAVYDLDVERMPEGEDFALWFLTESRRGYCVHFATATALMLRSLGIPARYVTGYLAETQANRWVRVTDAAAHAWVEYYLEGYGWLPLESTPPSELPVTATMPEEPGMTNEPEPNEPEPTGPEGADPIQPNEKPGAVPERPSEATPSSARKDKQARHWIPWLAALLAMLLLLGSRPLRCWLRERRLTTGEANQRALVLWERLTTLARHANTSLPPELEQLAQKARFSQHTLQPDELAQLWQHADLLTARLRAERAPLRWLKIRWIWADC